MDPAQRTAAAELVRDLAWLAVLVLLLLAAGLAMSNLGPVPLRGTVLLKNGTAIAVHSDEELERVTRAHAGDVASVTYAQGNLAPLGRSMSWSLFAAYAIGGTGLAYLERRRLAALLHPSLRGLAAGVAGGLLLVAAGFAWRAVAVRMGFVALPPEAPGVERGAWPVLVLGLGLAGPFAEELWFRGRLMRQLGQLGGTVAATLGTTILFAAVHGVPMLPFFVAFGLLAALLRFRTGGLFAPIVAHVLNNLVALAL